MCDTLRPRYEAEADICLKIQKATGENRGLSLQEDAMFLRVISGSAELQCCWLIADEKGSTKILVGAKSSIAD